MGKRLFITKLYKPAECQNSMWFTICFDIRLLKNVVIGGMSHNCLEYWGKIQIVGLPPRPMKEYHRVVGGGYRHLGKFPWGAVAPKDLKNPDLLS